MGVYGMRRSLGSGETDSVPLCRGKRLPGTVTLTLTFVFLTEGFARRKRTSLWFVGSLLLVSALILTIGLAATTRTENVTVGGYYPGIIVSQVCRVVGGLCVSTGWGAPCHGVGPLLCRPQGAAETKGRRGPGLV